MKKVHVFAGSDELRPAMNYVQFKNGYFYATDAHIAGKFRADAVFQLEGMPEEFYILAKDFKAMHSVNPIFFELKDGIISVHGKKSNFLCPFLTADQFSNKVGRYPDIDAVIHSGNNLNAGTIANVTYNAKLISRIAEGLGTDMLSFYFGEHNTKLTFVMSNITDEKEKFLSVIMPIYVSELDHKEAKNTINNLTGTKVTA